MSNFEARPSKICNQIQNIGVREAREKSYKIPRNVLTLRVIFSKFIHIFTHSIYRQFQSFITIRANLVLNEQSFVNTDY